VSGRGRSEFETDGGEPRIEKIEGDAEEIPEVNFGIYRSSKDYDLPASKDRSIGGTSVRSIVNRPYTLEQVVSLTEDFFDIFPRDEPLLMQSALWMRWFAGMHFFEDANHRTGMSTLRVTMQNNDREPPDELSDIKDMSDFSKTAIDASKEVRDHVEVSPSDMYEEDDLYEVWYRYFEEVL